MKKKKCLLASLVVLLCILVTVFSIKSIKERNTIDKIIDELEEAINKNDLNDIIGLYPEYYRDTVSNLLSQKKLDEFNNKIGEIKIVITDNNDYDSISISKEIKDRILDDYGINLKIEDYQIVMLNVTNKTGSVFEQTQLQVVKIKGQYYLYTEYYLGDLIQCFVE